MITQEQSKAIKKTLGHRFSPPVLEHLKDNQIFNRQGKPFHSSTISLVLNGKMEHEAIEKAIIDVWEKSLITQKKEQERKEKLLNAS